MTKQIRKRQPLVEDKRSRAEEDVVFVRWCVCVCACCAAVQTRSREANRQLGNFGILFEHLVEAVEEVEPLHMSNSERVMKRAFVLSTVLHEDRASDRYEKRR